MIPKQDFKQKNLKKHSELFDISDKLYALSDEMRYIFNCKSTKDDFRPSKIPIYKTVLLYLLNNAIQQFASIYILCLEGYGQCSSIILRSMFENLISVKYIILGEDEDLYNNKAKRYMEYRWIEMQKYLKYWKMDKEVIRKDLQINILSKENDVKKNVDNFKREFYVVYKRELSTWAGVSIETMAEDVGMLGDYNLTYRLCCSFSHPGFLGAQQSVIKNQKHTLFSSEPSFKSIILNLESSFQYFGQFLIIYDHMFNLGMKQKIFILQETAQKVFGIDKYK